MNDTSNPEGHIGWVAEPPHGRGTVSLLYSCLFTIYICTWSAVHLNVPADDDTSRGIVLRKFKWMVVAVLAPEYAATNAFRDWTFARAWVAELELWTERQRELYRLECRRSRIHRYWPKLAEWTMTHAFFIEMGGFSAELSNGARVRLSPGRFKELINDGMGLPFISEQEIQDRSKASWMTKLLACVQISWFVAQLIGRAIQRLPTSSLEAFTLAIVACTLMEYFLWMKKPFDVQTPIIINLATVYDGHILQPGVRLWKQENQKYTCRRSSHITELASTRHPNLNPFTLWNPHRAYFMTFVGLVFGACHLIAWDWSFPSHTEKLLWRISSIACATLPALFCFIQIRRGPGPETQSTRRRSKSKTMRNVPQLLDDAEPVTMSQYGTVLLLAIVMLPYLLCRLYLLVEIFAGLRSVPRGVYDAVRWSQYLPHF